MKGYKGFGKGLVCRGKQYAENTVFEEDKAVICSSGMHFCENPFEVLKYYPLLNKDGDFNEFAEVEALGETHTDNNMKYCTTKLKVGAKLSFSGFIKACVDFIIKKASLEDNDTNIGSSGDGVQIGSAGDDAKIGSSGSYVQIASSGDGVQIGSSGDGVQIGSAGDDAKIGSSGSYAKIASSGDGVQIGSAGDDAKIGSSGSYVQIASSGDGVQINSSGDDAKIGSSGSYVRIKSEGENSVICCVGVNSRARAKRGSWITLSEWRLNSAKKYIPICVKTEYVDGERIKEDTWYVLHNGEFEEWKER